MHTKRRDVCPINFVQGITMTMAFVNPQILTEKELALELKLSVSWLQKDRITERLIPYIKIGRSVRYNLGQVQASLQTRTEGGPVVTRRAA